MRKLYDYNIKEYTSKTPKAYYFLGLVASHVIEQIQQVLNTVYGLNKNKIARDGEMFILKFIGKQAKMFYEVIYKEADIRLQRKYQRYTTILSLDSAELSQYHGKDHEGMAKIDKLAL